MPEPVVAEPVLTEPVVAEAREPVAVEPVRPTIGERPTVSAPAEPATLFIVAQAAMAIVEPEESEAVAAEPPAAEPSTIAAPSEPGTVPAWEVEIPALEEGEAEPVVPDELFAAASDTASPIAAARAAHLAHETPAVLGNESIGTAPVEYTSELIDFGFDEEPDRSEPAPEPAPPPLLVVASPAATSPAAAPIEEQTGPRRKPPAPRPLRWRVPGWVAVPVLSIKIPHSLFAFGKPDGRNVPTVHAAEPPPADREWVTVGFVEPETPVVTAPPSPFPASPNPPRPPTAEPDLADSEPVPEPVREPEAVAPAEDQHALTHFDETAADEAPRVEPPSLDGAAPPAPQAAREPSAIIHLEPADPAPADLVEPETNVDEQLPSDTQSVRNRRLYRRVGLTAEFRIAGEPAELLDLSVEGFAIAGGPAATPNAPVTITLRLDNDEVSTQLLAHMVYADGDRSAGRFIELNAKQRAFLRYIVTTRAASTAAPAAAVVPLAPPAPQPSPPAEASAPQAAAPDEAPPALFPAYSYPAEHSAPVLSQQGLPWWRRLFRLFRNRPARADR